MLPLIILMVVGLILLIIGLSGVVGRLQTKGDKNMVEAGTRKKISFWKQFIPIVAILIAIFTIASVYDMVGPAYEFRREVHGHMENAYYADHPELMKKEIELSIDGMNNLNLERNMYGAFWPWDKTPDRKMDYQYKHLDGILNRVEAVIIWRDANYGENATGGTEALGDVYEAKMDNLRAFLQEEGWSDWIAQDTFYVSQHLWLYLFWLWYGIILLIAIIYLVYFTLRLIDSDGKKVWDETKKKWRWS